jgi:nitrogen fixation NifU-like protein
MSRNCQYKKGFSVMSMMREIYQQIIVDHSRNPRNFGEISGSHCSRTGHNRLCGDSLKLYAKIEDKTIVECKFIGEGCAIAMASASLLTEVVTGLTLEDATRLFKDLHGALVNGESFIESSPEHQRLAVFLGVAEYPARVKCATLSWQTLIAIIENSEINSEISTE